MNLTRIRITVTVVLTASISAFSQQEPRSAFFWNQYMHTNPAMTGAIYKHQANTQWRNQWTKINGAPTTLWANYAVNLDKINSGIGVSYEYDVIGLTRSHTALVSYAYHIPIKNAFLSLGVSAGMFSVGYKKKDLIYILPSGPLVVKDKTSFQSDFGLAFHGEKWNVGLSITQLNGFFEPRNQSYNQVPHYWLFGDYTFSLGENWKLTPRVQVFTDLIKLSSTEALITTWKERLWFGVVGSVPISAGFGTVGPTIGYDIIGKIRVGYAYEFWMSNNPFMNSGGTHEVILSYQLK